LPIQFKVEVSVAQAESFRAKLYAWSVAVAGAAALGVAVYHLVLEPVRLDWLLLLAGMAFVTWQGEVRLPGISSKVTLTDAFIFTGALLLGPWAATVLAAIDGLARSTRVVRRMRPVTFGVNLGAMSLSVLSALLLATFAFGPLPALLRDNGQVYQFLMAAALAALVNYLLNTAIVAGCIALWKNRPFFKTWREDYLWTWVAFIVGMGVAVAVSKLIIVCGFTSLLITLPVMALTYVTYKTYLGKVEASRQRIDKLTQLHLATIESLTLAIDAKDPLTRGHIQRVSRLAEGLARAVGYTEEQMEGLKAAALLHDIGKLAVPDYILNKPGKLTTAEYSKIMIHPVVGADILSNVEFPYEVVPIVKHHHERYDGGGYPSGLRGETIPVGARLLTIVDCYDALTTDRSYRQSYGRDDALNVMRSERGRMFDPLLLDQFIAIIDTLEDHVPVANLQALKAFEVEPLTTGRLLDPGLNSPPPTRVEKALRDITAAQGEALSLYEITQTLGSTLKLSEVLPVVAAKLECIANFTTQVIYLAEGDRLRVAYVTGKNAEALKGWQMAIGEGGAGWVAEHRQMLIGGSPLADLERPLGGLAAGYRSTAIFPLLHEAETVGALAFYCEQNSGYTPDELRLLETIATHTAAAIHNALAFERTQESALTDNLTGLPNSRFMYSFFDQERSRAERYGYPLVLMMMDLDGFKKINDTYGHHVGDEILRRVAETLRACMRSGDLLIRYAGDEFVALLHRATPEVVTDLKLRLQAAIDHCAYEVRPGRIAHVGISIGHVTYGLEGTAIEELMEIADQRMYADKAARKQSASPARGGNVAARAAL
jgi:diguanylate cyclase (GGDEF)-like protein/putative nucleotidyltransferase with HDIG domain